MPTLYGNNVDMMLVIDRSTSMHFADPDFKRLDAAIAYLLASLPNDQVGIVNFSGSSEPVPLTVINQDFRGSSIESLKEAIQETVASSFTSGTLGLDKACAELIKRRRAPTQAAILLTDGHTTDSLSSEAPEACFESNGWPIFSFGIGATNRTVLQPIATATSGEYIPVGKDDLDFLVCELQQLRARLVGASSLPSCRDYQYSLDVGVEESFEITIPPGQLKATFSTSWTSDDFMAHTLITTPSGGKISSIVGFPGYMGITSHKGGSFDVFTLPSPEPGTWKVELTLNQRDRDEDTPTSPEHVVFGVSTIPVSP